MKQVHLATEISSKMNVGVGGGMCYILRVF